MKDMDFLCLLSKFWIVTLSPSLNPCDDTLCLPGSTSGNPSPKQFSVDGGSVTRKTKANFCSDWRNSFNASDFSKCSVTKFLYLRTVITQTFGQHVMPVEVERLFNLPPQATGRVLSQLLWRKWNANFSLDDHQWGHAEGSAGGKSLETQLVAGKRVRAFRAGQEVNILGAVALWEKQSDAAQEVLESKARGANSRP